MDIKNLRWPALILIPLILAGLVFWERSDDDSADSQAIEASEASGLVWYCPILDQDGILELVNTTESEGNARLSFFASLFDGAINSEESVPYLAEAVNVQIPALSIARFNLLDPFVSTVERIRAEDVERVSRLMNNSGVFMSVLVEFSEPGMVADSALCINQVSSSWYIPFSSTNRDACYYLAVFNPFTAPAIIDVDFGTDEGRRSPYEGKVVPAGSSMILNISSKVTRRNHISTELNTRSGRVAAAKYLVFTGKPDGLERTCPSAPFDFEVREQIKLWGSQILVGAPEGSGEWFFPDGVKPSAAGSYTIYNTSNENSADVEVLLTPNFGSAVSLSVTVPPGQRQVVQLREGDLHPLPTFPEPVLAAPFSSPGIGHWASFKSETAIVVEKLLTGVQVPDGVSGGLGSTSLKTEIPIYINELNFGEETDSAFYGIANPLNETIAQVDIPGIVSGIEVGPGKLFILGIPRSRLRGDEVLVSTTPVAAAPLS